MKNMIIISGIVFFYSTSVNATGNSIKGTGKKTVKQDIHKTAKELRRDRNTINYRSNQTFMRDFPGAENASWARPSLFDEATFNLHGVTFTAYYDADNELVGTTSKKNFSDIPQAAQLFIQKNYKDYQVNEVILFDDNETNETDMELFSTAFNDEDNYFVALSNSKETIIVEVNMNGDTSFFKKI